MKILYFAPIDWDYIRQRPQHTAEQLSSFYAFYYIQPFGLRNLRVSDFRRIANRLSGLFDKRRPRENLHIVNLKFIPYINRYVQKINVSYLKKQLDPLAGNDTIAWITNPSVIMPDLINRMNFGKLIYEMMDDNEAIDSGRRHAVMTTEQWLIDRADLVITTSARLHEKTKKMNAQKKIVLVGNGVAYDFFNKKTFQKPKELEGMCKILGYVGSIDTWMDFETIQFLADRREDLSFVFVGPVKVKNLPSGKNIYFLGRRNYESVPDYCYFFDACLIPFTISKFTDTINPVKVYEYFALGKPVIAYEMNELAPFKHLLYLARNQDDFLEKIDLALAEADTQVTAKRKEFARLNDWSIKGTMLIDALSKL